MPAKIDRDIVKCPFSSERAFFILSNDRKRTPAFRAVPYGLSVTDKTTEPIQKEKTYHYKCRATDIETSNTIMYDDMSHHRNRVGNGVVRF